MQNKYYKPSCTKHALFTLQLINDSGTPRLSITTNSFDIKEWPLANAGFFGNHLAENLDHLLDQLDHEFLERMFNTYIYRRGRLKEKGVSGE
jgi:hypothetical protein